MKTIISIFFLLMFTLTSFTQSWTHEVSIPEITPQLFPTRTSTGTMMCKFPSSTWSANQIPNVNPGQSSLVSIVVPPGVSAVYCSYESNVWQQQNTEAPRFGHIQTNPAIIFGVH